MQNIEERWLEFQENPQKLRFGLGTDRVNPFGVRSIGLSTWPIILVNYNIPPWMATKTGLVLLALFIPGPHKGRNKDIYLDPLIEELEILWWGIQIHGVSCPIAAHETMVKGILI